MNDDVIVLDPAAFIIPMPRIVPNKKWKVRGLTFGGWFEPQLGSNVDGIIFPTNVRTKMYDKIY